ncbi:MAG: hypothetical protein KDC42_09895 [Ignavibacteriae bacterium]|nr:hypothetical protein [Ignavibacteriota bacterium]
MKNKKLMEKVTHKLEELNSLIKVMNSEVVKMINISAETELSMRKNDVQKLAGAEKKIEEILKKHINKED